MSKKSSVGLLFIVSILAALPAFAFPITRCQCSAGIDRDNRSIPVSETYCGYKICGLGNTQWECTEAGWTSLGSCGTVPPECSSGVNQWGKPIHPNTTFLNYTTCGRSYTQRFSCASGGNWAPASPSCTFRELCRCYDGRDQNNNLIPPANTYCGYAAFGVGSEKWQCTAGGWETGMLETDPGTNDVPGALARDNFRELVKSLRGDASIKAVLFFNATGRNPAFLYNHLMTAEEWLYITGGHAQL